MSKKSNTIDGRSVYIKNWNKLCVYFHKTHDHHNLQTSELRWKANTNKVTWPFDHAITWRLMKNKKRDISPLSRALWPWKLQSETVYLLLVTLLFLLVTRYFYWLLVAFYSLLYTFYLLFAIFCSLLVTLYLLLFTSYSLLFTRYFLLLTRHFLLITHC